MWDKGSSCTQQSVSKEKSEIDLIRARQGLKLHPNRAW